MVKVRHLVERILDPSGDTLLKRPMGVEVENRTIPSCREGISVT